ncbi:hypothetical protein N7G274_005305 [Stereocaulon virgatum]|uniref:Structure-specific endonuclease subunit SLX4 n=1 Tax=Stereocaulon virgatum TaxID=373712 RepID=A0ABR4A881_9LECA
MSSSPLPSPSQLFSSIPHRPLNGSRATPTSVDGLLLGSEKGHGVGHGTKMPLKTKKPKAEKRAPMFRKPGVSQEKNIEPLERDAAAAELDKSVSSTKAADVHNPKRSCRKKSKEEVKAAQLNDNVLATRKPRKKKSKGDSETQTTIKKTGITKPGALVSSNGSNKTAATTKKPEEPITVLAELPVGTQAEDSRARVEFRELCLEKAIPLRREWTPVKDTTQGPHHSDDIETSTASIPRLDTPTLKAFPTTSLGELVGKFEFTRKDDDLASAFEVTRQSDGEAMVKRRKIELVNGSCAPPAEKPQRSRSPKKKPQTVTGKATAPFAPAEIPENSSLLQYFGASALGPEANNAQTNENEIPETVRRKSTVKKTVKPRSTMAKVKKPKQRILLSPESAMKTSLDQELLFGTSSQLAREDSPTLLKDLQKAMKESEQMDDHWGLAKIPSAKFKPNNSLAVTQSKDLWSVASRDPSGALLYVEVVDLSITPKPNKTFIKPEAVTVAPKVAETEPEAQQDGKPRALVAEVHSAPVHDFDATPALRQQSQEPELVIPRSVAEAALKKRPKSKSPVKKAADVEPRSDQMPNYKGFTDVQLSRKVASYGFKSIKRRDAMIVLLERCWESQVALASQEVPLNANIPQSTTSDAMDEQSKEASPVKKKAKSSKVAASKVPNAETANDTTPKKPRGRPRKDSSTTTSSPKRKRKSAASGGSRAEVAVLAADEIYDSSPPTPSPPRRRSPPKSPGQLPLSQPLSTSILTKAPLEKTAQIRLFENISRAIKTFPPTSDPKNLTFHEKMLMFEPVVLEDLAIWLNAEGLDRVGEDDEVSPALVKEWCEEKSVCCLWRENLRGGTRSRW